MSYEMKKRVIGLKNPTFQTRNENSDDVRVDQAPNLRFAVPQCLLGALAFCDVGRSADDLDELPVPVENRVTRRNDVLDCSIRQQNPVLVEAVNLFVDHPRKSRVCPVAILRMDSLPKVFAGR